MAIAQVLNLKRRGARRERKPANSGTLCRRGGAPLIVAPRPTTNVIGAAANAIPETDPPPVPIPTNNELRFKLTAITKDPLIGNHKGVVERLSGTIGLIAPTMSAV